MMFTAYAPALLLLALALDALVGDPDWLWRRLSHPVVVMGRAIAALEAQLNRRAWSFPARRIAGLAALSLLLAPAIGGGLLLHRLVAGSMLGAFVEVCLVAVLLAGRSLYDHVARVAAAFETGGLAEARTAVSMIVGRDPESLDEAGVSRAAIETLAENFSDGLVAPACWYLVAGLPGILIYKLVNTADSMIGHRSERYHAYGWAAARLDDVLNLVPARISGLLIVAAAAIHGWMGVRQSFAAMWRDAPRHKSPNAGWPEAAMAGALGLALAGPRRYGGTIVDDHWMNAGGRQEATAADIRRALRLYVLASFLGGLGIAILSVLAR
ncbi:MAG: adenosylcobinamide-phosphate synthase CbiB [Hyphomicrobiaceae bacterium]